MIFKISSGDNFGTDWKRFKKEIKGLKNLNNLERVLNKTSKIQTKIVRNRLMNNTEKVKKSLEKHIIKNLKNLMHKMNVEESEEILRNLRGDFFNMAGENVNLNL